MVSCTSIRYGAVIHCAGATKALRAEGFARVELEEVDGLGDISIGLSPILADFEYQPGVELEASLLDDLAPLHAREPGAETPATVGVSRGDADMAIGEAGERARRADIPEPRPPSSQDPAGQEREEPHEEM